MITLPDDNIAWGDAPGYINVAPLGLTKGVALGGIKLRMITLPGAMPQAILMSPRWGLPGALPLAVLN